MKKREKTKNLRLYAVNRENRSGFDIFLGYPGGERQYVRTSRHNGLLYAVMKDGVRVDDLNRWLTGGARLNGVGEKRSDSRSAAHVEGSIRQILKLVTEMRREQDYDRLSLGSLAARAGRRNPGRGEALR